MILVVIGGAQTTPATVSFTFQGVVTDIVSTAPPPFDQVQVGDAWSLVYVVDETLANDVDGHPTAGQYRDLVVDVYLMIGGNVVSGAPGPACPAGLYSGIFVNLSNDYADYAVEIGLPDESAYAHVILRDDGGTPFSDDALPLVIPTPLADVFPTNRLFTLRQTGSSAIYLMGCLESCTVPVRRTTWSRIKTLYR